jgi:cell division protein FtsN
MSRLDYITIGIVTLCVLAILFLVYKMTNIFKEEEPAAEVVETVEEASTLSEDVYDYQIRPDDTTSASDVTPQTESAPQSDASTPATATVREQTSVNNQNTASGSNTSVAGSPAAAAAQPVSKPVDEPKMSEGKYLVLAGTFQKRAGADKEVARIQKLGYPNARVEIFDRGKYAVVLVDRFDNLTDAQKLAKELKTRGVNCLIKNQQ